MPEGLLVISGAHFGMVKFVFDLPEGGHNNTHSSVDAACKVPYAYLEIEDGRHSQAS